MWSGVTRVGVFCACSIVVSAGAMAQARYYDVQAPPGGSYPSIYGLSSDGTVAVGNCFIGGQARPLKWTREEGSVDLAGSLDGVFNTTCSAGGGIAVLGFGTTPEGLGPWRWTPQSGLLPLPLPQGGGLVIPYGVSEDGLAVGGFLFDGQGCRPFRWTESVGYQMVPPVGVNPQVRAISADGSTLVGVFGYGGPQTFVWRAGIGTIEIPLGGTKFPPPPGVSYDGRFVVGANGDFAALYNSETQALTVPENADGTQTTGFAVAVTADGATVLGNRRYDGPAFIWDAQHGARDLSYVLHSEYGLNFGASAPAVAMSADGAVIAGINWVVTLREPVRYTGRPPCQGDISDDGRVDVADLLLVLSEYRQTGPDLIADVTGDEVVDALDLNIVLQDFGDMCGARRPPASAY